MSPIKEMPTYKFADIVLSQKDSFTLKDVLDQLNEIGVSIDENMAQMTLNRLRDNWIISESNSVYCLSINDF